MKLEEEYSCKHVMFTVSTCWVGFVTVVEVLSGSRTVGYTVGKSTVPLSWWYCWVS